MCLSASYFRIDLTRHRLHLLIIQGSLWVVITLEDQVGKAYSYCLEDLEDLVEVAFLLLEALEGEA